MNMLKYVMCHRQVNSKIRRSETAWLNKHDHDAMLEKLDYRMYQLTGVPVEHGEHPQVVRYPNGGFYKDHYDTDDVSTANL